jgi:hypothetical protein
MKVTFHITPEIYEKQPESTPIPRVGDELEFHGVKTVVKNIEVLVTLERVG